MPEVQYKEFERFDQSQCRHHLHIGMIARHNQPRLIFNGPQAVGLGDGLGAGDNTRAALITRGLAEVTRLGTAMGGRPETFAGLAGIGDMIATCNSPQSRNRHVGLELAKGKSVEEITSAMNMVAEGVKSAPTVVSLANKFDVEVPICAEIHRILEGKADATRVYRGLLRVVAGAESEPG